ncbi:MAG: peptide chain release factor 1, partial [Actinobacteria bacterium]|nr:peptide chain release factor 1 [Actinomycetota bacterium]
MIDKLREIEERYNEITEKLGDPDILSDQEKYREYAKAHSELSPLVSKIKRLSDIQRDIADSREMIKEERDQEMREFLEKEVHALEEERAQVEEEIKIDMIAKDPNDEKNIIVEVRAGTGGEEAALFAADLSRMYTHFAERNRWKTEILSSSPSDVGGFKEIIFEVKGKGAYSRLKYESGVHRVQRIPVTESGGRIHTSTATVAVLPEVEEVEAEINPQDVRVDIFRSGGPGGQSVNTTDSAVRLTHLPTGIVVSCQDERSQLQNKDRAFRILRARLYEMKIEEQEREQASARRSQVGTGDRSERIRTYNFPQNRVTDHRIGFTTHDLGGVLEGALTELLDHSIEV